MTADHPTREERYAAVLHAMAVEDNPGHADWDDCATTGPCREEGQRFAALVAADPAPAQPDAALSDGEREALGDWWDSDWPADAPHVLVTLYATVERILAARAAQPVPAPEVSRGVAEALPYHARLITCPECRSTFEAEDGSAVRPEREVKAEALREAADEIAAESERRGGMYAGDVEQLVRDRADRLVGDALGGERGDGA